MKLEVARRSFGLAAGVALLAVGALEVAISRANFESPQVRPFCRAGFCAEQFSPERVFEIAQKAALGDARGELNDFKQAVQLSPASAYRWADLGDAEFNVHDYAQAEYAFSQALKAGPRSPVILMRAANLYFEIGDTNLVVRQLAKLLSDPGLNEYYETAFLTYSRLGLPVEQILEQGVPRRKAVLSSLLTFWTKVHKTDEAVATWKWASAQGLADGESTGKFFSFLIAADRAEEAQQLWQDYASKQEPGYRNANWIYNPGFESEPLTSPFDWNVIALRDVEAVREQDVKYDGNWAFRLRFNGETNTAYHQTFQDMVLAPGKYRFSVMMKTEQVTTDEGVRIHIFDQPSQAKLNVWMDTMTGTQDWKQISKNFEVPGGVKLVRVEIARMSSGMFDNKIGGTTWLDGLLLVANR